MVRQLDRDSDNDSDNNRYTVVEPTADATTDAPEHRDPSLTSDDV